MRIAIDARLNAYRQGGIPQYTRQLLTALAEVSPEDEFISLQHRDQLRPLAIAPNVARRTVLTPPHHRFEQWTLPLEALLARPHVLHCPDFIAPVRRACPAVVTIHDLAFMHYPEILDTAASAYYGQVTRNTARADAVIAVSEATRQDIAQFLDIPIEQIDLIYEAAAPLYTRLELRAGEARVLNSTPIEAGTFMLFVSTLEPRKNLPTLLRALRICLDRQPHADYRLVVVGRRGWRDEEIFTAVRDLKLGAHVLFAGGVGQYDLRWLYNACRLYINPSLYEGFGLPLLEAMACGAACLAAATSSLPEIGGNAALYVPPLDAEAWADEIAALWDDQERRAELGRLGVARAQRFSWLRAARETLAVYKRAADRIVPVPMPRSAQSQAVFADQLASPPAPWAIPAPGGARACLRCGAEMTPGKLQQYLSMIAADQADANQVLLPRLWSCASCGHVELVVDWALAIQDEADSVAVAAELVNPLAHPVDDLVDQAPAEPEEREEELELAEQVAAEPEEREEELELAEQVAAEPEEREEELELEQQAAAEPELEAVRAEAELIGEAAPAEPEEREEELELEQQVPAEPELEAVRAEPELEQQAPAEPELAEQVAAEPELAEALIEQRSTPEQAGDQQTIEALPDDLLLVEARSVADAPPSAAELAEYSAPAANGLVGPADLFADRQAVPEPAIEPVDDGAAMHGASAPAELPASDGEQIADDVLAEPKAAAVGGSDGQHDLLNGRSEAGRTEPLATPPKQPRSPRRAQTAAAENQPAKRRASRSKRK